MKKKVMQIKLPESEKYRKVEVTESGITRHFFVKNIEILGMEVSQQPTTGKCFEVNLETINQDLFKKERHELLQETTRQLILEALKEVKNNPKKYRKLFYTMIPDKNCSKKTTAELMKFASKLGDHMADWVEQALEWAQRISNGEKWVDVCNMSDMIEWYRLITWKNGYSRCVGGCYHELTCFIPASYVDEKNKEMKEKLYNTVPLVVLYA